MKLPYVRSNGVYVQIISASGKDSSVGALVANDRSFQGLRLSQVEVNLSDLGKSDSRLFSLYIINLVALSFRLATDGEKSFKKNTFIPFTTS